MQDGLRQIQSFIAGNACHAIGHQANPRHSLSYLQKLRESQPSWRMRALRKALPRGICLARGSVWVVLGNAGREYDQSPTIQWHVRQ
jgi:hypothetical protein